ncbi:GNAT family N-acetyltransferase [Pseudoalteromonas xiamenensis]|uniref:GNAT family N-acetyltransferase n=1 Tax=Pseudoalteromonas xiamenensis TaxID=882626 RepID=UPI0027E4C724|nr:GNAT family N-acetyltransferase [Pseudoalteromonas xiamenensis]WMN60149.1 GNAT family N-acetyltransferase [Pseudoalteromonas xiamenensis]
MFYRVDKVSWLAHKNELQQIREKVFVCELHIPKSVEFDDLDLVADHVLVKDETECPVATGRLCKDGLISRIAVLQQYRTRETYDALLKFIVLLAEQNGLKNLCINCILHEVDLFTAKGFEKKGSVFMEAGIPRQRLQCHISEFSTEPFTLVH